MEIKNTDRRSPQSMKLLESVNNCSISMSFSVSIFMFWNLTLSNFSIIYWLSSASYKVCSAIKKERNAVVIPCLFCRFDWGSFFVGLLLVCLFVSFVGLDCFSFPSHLLTGHDPSPLASAGVWITEKHDSVAPVLPLAERFYVGLVTTKVKLEWGYPYKIFF